jgi:hypothetical protein
LLPAPLAVAAALILTGCGGSHLDPAATAAYTAEAFTAQIAHDHAAAACAQLTDHAKRQLTQRLAIQQPGVGGPDAGCRVAIGLVARSYTTLELRALQCLHVKHVNLRGDRALISPADVSFPTGYGYLRSRGGPMVLRQAPGGWQIDDLG